MLTADAWSLRDHDFAACWRGSPGVDLWRQIEPSDATRQAEQQSPCGGGCRARAVGAGGGIGDIDPWLAPYLID